MLTPENYICAVGDSFVFGAELVTTHFGSEFQNVSAEEYHRLEYEVSLNKEAYSRYYKLLDSMRFSSLVAKTLGALHINYAQGGASQEGIKFQTYLLLDTLTKKNIDLANTTWLVGLTSPFRQLHQFNEQKEWHRMKSKITGDENYVWSRTTVCTIFADRLEQNIQVYSPSFIKELISKKTESIIYLQWAMNILDVHKILSAAGVGKIVFLNIFSTEHFKFTGLADLPMAELLANLLSEVPVYPSKFVNLGEYVNQNLPNRAGYCKYGHFNELGNKLIAEYLLNTVLK